VDYSHAKNTPENPHNHWIVSSLTEDDRIPENGNSTTLTYSYGPGEWDWEGMFKRATKDYSNCMQNAFSADFLQ
jgi:hypothetical protein